MVALLACQKNLFKIPEDICYLNSAYMGPLPIATLEAGQSALEMRACPTTIQPQDFFVHADRVRERCAKLVNTSSDSIAFISTAAYGIATVAKNISFSAGQNIVILAEQFPSNVYTWRNLQTLGVQIRTVARPVNTEKSVNKEKSDQGNSESQNWSDAVIAAIDGNTALVAVETAHWTDGTLFDIARIGAAAHGVGAWMLVDGTQTVGAQPFDFSNANTDALIVHSYKSMLCNYGLGFAAFSQRMRDASPLEESWLLRKGSEDFSRLVDYQDEYAPGMRRFDTSTRANPSLILMLDQSTRLLGEWQPTRIREYTLSIARKFVASAQHHGYSIEEESNRAGNIFGIRPPNGTDLNAIRVKLAEQKIYVSVRGSAIRISPHVYNHEGDFARLAEVLGIG
jgi:selenocysteine lyase/cysteine desulfurase